MDLAKFLLEFFIGKSGEKSNRTTVFVLIVILLIIANHSIGFTSNYYYSNKIQNISKITTILSNNKLDSTTRIKVERMQNELISESRWLTKEEHDNLFFSIAYMISFAGLPFIILLIAFVNSSRKATWSERIWMIIAYGLILIVLSSLAWIFAYIPATVIAYLCNIVLQAIFIYAILWAQTKVNSTSLQPQAASRVQ